MAHIRKIIIAKHGCKQFANRLWSDMSVYAYALEMGTPRKSPPDSRGVPRKSPLDSRGVRVADRTFLEHIPFLKPLHEIYWRLMRNLHTNCGVFVWTNWKLLPPSRPLDEKHGGCRTLYFYGWLFRNPEGMEKYRSELLRAFAPKTMVQKKVAAIIGGKKRLLIGVYVRYALYTYFENGEFLVSAERTEQIMEEYLRENNLSKNSVGIIRLSDHDDPAVSFYALAQCDAVIGTNSMHCNLAAWMGDVPHIVATDEPIDWGYYRGKKTYFENKYATFAFGSTKP